MRKSCQSHNPSYDVSGMAKRIIHFSRSLFVPVFFMLACLLLVREGHTATLSLSGTLEQGTAVLLHVENVPLGARLKGTLNGAAFPFSKENSALLALDMETKPGKVTLRVKVTPPKGKREVLTRRFTIAKRHYKEEHITLPKKKVNLNSKDLARAKKETASIRATYKRRGGKAGYSEGFQQPVQGRFSGVFGSRRVLNGQARRPHSGVDIAAPKGTPVVATAPGKVALVGQDYFFTGNTLVLDHGDGVISLYAHLDTITVKKGAWVASGTTIGTIGMTGRATGPHLHWSVLVRRARVDPMRLPGIL